MEHPAERWCKRCKLFAGHSMNGQLASLLSKTRLVEYSTGGVLFHAGDEGTSLYILTSGDVTCFDKNDVEIKVLKPGELCIQPVMRRHVLH